MRRRHRKIVSRTELARIARRMERRGLRLVFTNGCFDLLHPGHVRLLQAARRLGDALAVGVNSDASVRRLKGRGRPIVPAGERMEILAALEVVDYVVEFGEATPYRILLEVGPRVLVKGGDWDRSRIVGRAAVESRGGRVKIIPLRKGISTTRILEKILARFGK